MEENKEVEEKSQKSILIFGISGFLGSNLAEFLKKDYKVYGTYYKTPVNIPGVFALSCDVLQKDAVQLVLYATKPDITLYCVGYNNIEKCAENSNVADALNTSGLFNVTEMCQRYQSQICYFSNYFVYAGDNVEYAEMDTPDPGTMHGKTKASGEFYIQKNSLNYMVYRTCHLYGRHINPNKKSIFEKLQTAVASTDINVFDNYVYQGFLDVYYLCLVVKMCIERSATNRLMHISSKDIMSFYEFAGVYCKVFKENMSRIAKGKWALPLVQLRDTTEDNWYYRLDTKNLEGFLNIDIPTIEESLQTTFKRFNGDPTPGKKKAKGGSIPFL